jgi:hypothetical protein
LIFDAWCPDLLGIFFTKASGELMNLNFYFKYVEDQILNISLTLPSSEVCTKPVLVRLRLRLVDFLVRMWLLKACFLLILPVPVKANRFFALDLVFTFGILLYFIS